MKSEPLEVVGLDSYSGNDFAVYFSDDTYVTVTSAELAECFPERTPIAAPDLEGCDSDETKKEEGGWKEEG